MNIWIDLANSPQVLFFRPILAELQSRGHKLFITSRDFAQTLALADEYDIANTPVGRHGGKKWTDIIGRNASRAVDLIRWIKTKAKIDLAVSHNSYTQALAAAWLHIPFVTLMDYEHQPLNHLCFRLAKRVIVPQYFPDNMLRIFGALSKTKKYAGLKEEIYLADFHSDPEFRKEQKFDAHKILVVVRPPAPWTAYHRFENTLFDDVLSYLANFEQAVVVFLPRIKSQADWARQLGMRNLLVPGNTLNGPNLLYLADLVISGGGTMNREAAVLGTPTYTVFKGKMGSVDQFLIDSGQMIQITEVGDVKNIKVEKKPLQKDFTRKDDLVKQVVDLIINSVVE